MDLKEQHLQLIKERGRFFVDCSHAIFSMEELKLLEKYGHWFKALQTGEIKPFTNLQKQFVKVANGDEQPFSMEETAWFKYTGRKRLEKEDPGRFRVFYEPEKEFFSNEDYYKMHPGKKPKF